MDKELKLEKEIKKLYIGYEDKNPTNKKLFKLAKRTIKKGLPCFDYSASFDLDKPIKVSEFDWSKVDLNYDEFINNHLNYLNRKFNGYFKFKVFRDDMKYRITGFYSEYDALVVTFTVYCDKISEEEN